MGIGLKSFTGGLMNMIQQERDMAKQRAEEERKMATQLAYQKALTKFASDLDIGEEEKKAKRLAKIRETQIAAGPITELVGDTMFYYDPDATGTGGGTWKPSTPLTFEQQKTIIEAKGKEAEDVANIRGDFQERVTRMNNETKIAAANIRAANASARAAGASERQINTQTRLMTQAAWQNYISVRPKLNPKDPQYNYYTYLDEKTGKNVTKFADELFNFHTKLQQQADANAYQTIFGVPMGVAPPITQPTDDNPPPFGKKPKRGKFPGKGGNVTRYRGPDGNTYEQKNMSKAEKDALIKAGGKLL